MKYTISTFVISLCILCLPFTQSVKTLVRNHMSNTKSFEIPQSMQNLINKSSSLSLPCPKKESFKILNFLYDLESYGCEEGIKMGEAIRNINSAFIKSLKPINEADIDDVNENVILLEEALSSIMRRLVVMSQSNCAGFLKKKALDIRRSVYMMTLK